MLSQSGGSGGMDASTDTAGDSGALGGSTSTADASDDGTCRTVVACAYDEAKGCYGPEHPRSPPGAHHRLTVAPHSSRGPRASRVASNEPRPEQGPPDHSRLRHQRDAASKRQDPAVRDQEEALRRLREMGSRARNRLRVVEVGNTHEKIVICDDQYVILTSFNFLSLNPKPGRGSKREMGYRITNAAMVADVRARIGKALMG